MPEQSVDDALVRELKRTLSVQRFQHVEGVVASAEQLAQKYGVSVRKARTAAWLHDLAREWPREQLLSTVRTFPLPDGFEDVPALLHGPIAAHIGKTQFGILEEDILDAVRYHTTGRPNMTPLDLVLFVADAIEPGRTYGGVEEIREASQRSLEEAARISIDGTLRFMLDAKRPIVRLTVEARNSLLGAELREA
ncbi:bis(5'-nucleosyl)-tetraphosphatase (symmetrical) YqeK [Alicyclobacillus acidiphilus]|jgi:predicted HD superfamily hydrolase involved in NAD metabolism|uniref:bis(5'-nucleosyl)-tetraphosphatase (symmetrical) YqeK n=1 Tax=Alicyclobacillus acidiphilus TaxID=182455 RepID=UPI000A46AF6A|nr:bis(5'-nucleosyl)-tetraphosphatase (symmetrical) YqeK [Alicyclobacillus acidiphilus]